jgi:hypothetical protein
VLLHQRRQFIFNDGPAWPSKDVAYEKYAQKSDLKVISEDITHAAVIAEPEVRSATAA